MVAVNKLNQDWEHRGEVLKDGFLITAIVCKYTNFVAKLGQNKKYRMANEDHKNNNSNPIVLNNLANPEKIVLVRYSKICHDLASALKQKAAVNYSLFPCWIFIIWLLSSSLDNGYYSVKWWDPLNVSNTNNRRFPVKRSDTFAKPDISTSRDSASFCPSLQISLYSRSFVIKTSNRESFQRPQANSVRVGDKFWKFMTSFCKSKAGI